jgi:hypothetical protein
MNKIGTLVFIIGLLFAVAGCETLNTGGGRVEGCSINMKYCSPGP